MSIKIFNGLATALKRVAAWYHPQTWRKRGIVWVIGLLVITAGSGLWVLGIIWGQEPGRFDVGDYENKNDVSSTPVIVGYTTAKTLSQVVQVLLDKPGGYLTNDVTPPGLFMDNIPNWEYGVLVQVRDMARSLRNDMSRSQSQSIEDKNLAAAEPLFNFDSDSWLVPPSERQYRKAIRAVDRYADLLTEKSSRQSRFFARADNLREWLAVVEKRLGSLSQRLSASVGQTRINTDLAGDPDAVQSTPAPEIIEVKTPWLEIDDVFYEARGTTWALIHFMQAVEHDFADVLKKKNARVSLQQIVRELEGAQEPIWSPMVLNGRGFGFVTNYSLIMASYISRANAAVIDLKRLLEQG